MEKGRVFQQREQLEQKIPWRRSRSLVLDLLSLACYWKSQESFEAAVDTWIGSLEASSGLEIRIWEHWHRSGGSHLKPEWDHGESEVKKRTKAVLRGSKTQSVGSLRKTSPGDWGGVQWGNEEKHNYFPLPVAVIGWRRWVSNSICSNKGYLLPIGENKNYGTLVKKKNLALKKDTKEKTCFKHT